MSFPNWCNSSSERSWASLKYTEEDERERWRLKVKIRRFVKISIEKILFWCQLIQLKEVHRTELKRRNRKRDRFVRLFCLGNNSTFYFYTVISTWFVDFFFFLWIYQQVLMFKTCLKLPELHFALTDSEDWQMHWSILVQCQRWQQVVNYIMCHQPIWHDQTLIISQESVLLSLLICCSHWLLPHLINQYSFLQISGAVG